MAVDKQEIQRHLRNFTFKELFNELGWDNPGDRKPLTVACKGQIYTLNPLTEKRGVKVYLCSPDAQGHIPDDERLKLIDREVKVFAGEHIIIYVNAAAERQTWQWTRSNEKKRSVYRTHKLYKKANGELQHSELLAQKLATIAFALDEEEKVTTPVVIQRVTQAFDVERVTKKFYERFKKEHERFLGFIDGVTSQGDREWYTSLMLNRLMFIYFIQRQGFLGTTSEHALDGDRNYLRKRLEKLQAEHAQDSFYSFYRYFLLRLFHEGLSKRAHTPELERLLGKVPYLNGGLFDIHILERDNPEIQIPDEAFQHIFDFFDEYDWHLDDRPQKSGKEINPDVLGYIFEKYINQKQMGAYYTKEDITEYISKNTIIPYLFEAAEKKCAIAFETHGPVWSLLRDNPEDYIYDAVARGCELPLPARIEAGLQDITRRTEWNERVPKEEEDYALPTEIWREVVARRKRYEEVRAKIAAGEITTGNDLITYNLDIRQFAHDVISYCDSADLLLAFYTSIEQVTVLDPTCGSGAFLFAALHILQPLYDACLTRMRTMVAERDELDSRIPPTKRQVYNRIDKFRVILRQVEKHHNQAYFILKSIIINNLYGADIMEEAVEICKLRLFLKLVAQVEKLDDIEPLPDIDFNIRAGNTLVGFVNMEEVRKAANRDIVTALTSQETLARIEIKAQEIERDAENFRKLQTDLELSREENGPYKQQLQNRLEALRDELNPYLAAEYGIHKNTELQEVDKKKYEELYTKQYKNWKESHQPFHWLVDFYGIMQRGGFDVIIGNPPYVEYNKVRKEYQIYGYHTEECGNLYAFSMERSFSLIRNVGLFGMIVQLSSICTDRMSKLQEEIRNYSLASWISNYDDRPAKLFDGLEHIRASIVLSKISKVSETQTVMYSTNLMRWYTECRDTLFPSIYYGLVTHLGIPGSIPKIGDNQLEQLIDKVKRKIRTVNEVYNRDSKYLVYYYRSPLYWIRAMDFLPSFESNTAVRSVHHFKDFNLTSATFVKPVGCLINSSLFYLWFIVYGNGRNVALRDIQTFPCDVRELYLQSSNTLDNLFIKLMQDYKDHSKIQPRKDGIRLQSFYPAFSKSIMDEIDCVLARHYGFTDEELDFIINYDIKYRMGRDTSEEDEG
ncbi:MAG: hypothetical protein NVS4B9_03720 [Ktedonobacteraceae bacterium]